MAINGRLIAINGHPLGFILDLRALGRGPIGHALWQLEAPQPSRAVEASPRGDGLHPAQRPVGCPNLVKKQGP